MALIGNINPDGLTPQRPDIDPRLAQTIAMINRLTGKGGDFQGGDFGAIASGPQRPNFSGAGSSSRVESPRVPPMPTRGDPRRGEVANIGQGSILPKLPAFAGANAMMGLAGIASNVAANAGVGAPGAPGVGAGYGQASQAMPSFEEILAQVVGSGQVATPDAAAMADKQFDPQFDMLSQLRTATTGRMNQQEQDARAMYDALAQSIDADKSGVAQSYDTAAQNMDAAFSEANEQVAATGERTNADMAAMMKRLGISEAAPDTTALIAQDQNMSANNIAEMQANYSANNEANAQSMNSYLTNQANTAGLAGANAGADVNAALQQMLMEYDTQELGLRGQQAQTENEYLMSIMGMQQDAAGQAQDTAMRMYEQQLAQQQQALENSRWDQEFDWERQMDQSNLEIQRAAEERALQELLTKAREGGPSGNSRPDPNTAMLQAASQLWPEDDNMARTAVQRLNEALAANPEVSSLPELLAALSKRHPGNPYKNQYDQLASVFANVAF